MVHDEPGSTDVSRYERKQEAAAVSSFEARRERYARNVMQDDVDLAAAARTEAERDFTANELRQWVHDRIEEYGLPPGYGDGDAVARALIGYLYGMERMP